MALSLSFFVTFILLYKVPQCSFCLSFSVTFFLIHEGPQRLLPCVVSRFFRKHVSLVLPWTFSWFLLFGHLTLALVACPVLCFSFLLCLPGFALCFSFLFRCYLRCLDLFSLPFIVLGVDFYCHICKCLFL